MSSKSLRNIVSYPAIVGQVLSKLRKNNKFEQADFAKIIGVTQSTLSRIETGASALTIEQLAMAADELYVTPAYILELADESVQDLQRQGIEIQNNRVSEGLDKGMVILGAAAIATVIALIVSKSK